MSKQIFNKCLVWLLMLCMVFTGFVPASYADEDEPGVTQAVYEGSTPIKATLFAPTAVKTVNNDVDVDEAIQKLIGFYRSQGVPTSEWAILGLNALGEDINRGSYVVGSQSYAQNLLDIDIKNTVGDLAKKIIALQSLGYDPRDFDGQNLVEQLQSQPTVSGIHEAFFGLIALDAVGAIETTNVKLTRDILIEKILTSNRIPNGWSFGYGLDVDTTAMAIYALAPYQNRTDVKQAIDTAVFSLQDIQENDGGFGNSSSTIQVIQALTVIGIDPQGPRFAKDNGHNPVTNLLTYQLDTGGFKYLAKDKSDSPFSNEQTAIAFAALKQFNNNGKANVFHNINYSGGTPPPLVLKPFSVVAKQLERNGGFMATVNVSLKENMEHSEPIYVVFQLMNNKEPVSMVALREAITTEKEVTAFFNVTNDTSYQVKVLILDQITNPSNIGIRLAKQVIVK